MHLHPDTARNYIATIDKANIEYPGMVDCVGPTLALAENAIRQVADLKVVYKVTFKPGEESLDGYARLAEWYDQVLPTMHEHHDLKSAKDIAQLAAEYGIKATIYSRTATPWEPVSPTENEVR